MNMMESMFNNENSRTLDSNLQKIQQNLQKYKDLTAQVNLALIDYEGALGKVSLPGTFEPNCLLNFREKLDVHLTPAGQLCELFGRKEKKVVFYGSISNGKSATINALLGQSLLPSRAGHTTDSFLTLTGWDQGSYLLDTDDQQEEYQTGDELKTRLLQLVNVTDTDLVEEVPVYNIKLPSYSQTVVKEDVLFVDCPGQSVSDVFDTALQRHCQDADIFIVVTDAVRTLTVTERSFLEKAAINVGCAPLVFAVNKWDLVDEEERHRMGSVWKRDIDRFLEEHLPTQQINENVCHFISATKALSAKQTDSTNQYTESFASFETAIQELVLQRKEQLATSHFDRTNSLIRETKDTIVRSISQADDYRKEQIAILDQLEDWDSINERDRIISSQCELFRSEVKDEIHRQENDIGSHINYFCSNKETTEEVANHLFDFTKQKVTGDVNKVISGSGNRQIRTVQENMISCLSQGLQKYSAGFENDARRISVTQPGDLDLDILVPRYQGETLHLRRHRPGGVIGAAGDSLTRAFGGESSQHRRQRRQIEDCRRVVIDTYTRQVTSALNNEKDQVIEQAWKEIAGELCTLWDSLWSLRSAVLQTWKQHINTALHGELTNIRALQDSIDEIIQGLNSIELHE